MHLHKHLTLLHERLVEIGMVADCAFGAISTGTLRCARQTRTATLIDAIEQ